MKMFLPKVNFLPSLPSSLLFTKIAIAAGIGSTFTGIHPVLSQTAIPNCQPPNAGEYLLFVVSPTVNNQQQLRSALPSDLKTVTCRYLNETVTRVGGFNKVEDANRWARYVNNVVGLSAIITTRPTASTVAPTTIAPTTIAPTTIAPTTVATQSVSYNPRVLGEGFAVLVDYFNRPELANNVQKIVGGNVGLVSYGERPYLLAVYTTNQSEAYRTLQKLSENGLFALLADGRKVVLLRSVVTIK
jgi:hypothetical protein